VVTAEPGRHLLSIEYDAQHVAGMADIIAPMVRRLIIDSPEQRLYPHSGADIGVTEVTIVTPSLREKKIMLTRIQYILQSKNSYNYFNET